MNKVFAVLRLMMALCVVLVAASCSVLEMTPDGDDTTQMSVRFMSLDNELKLDLGRWATNRWSSGWLNAKNRWAKVGSVNCLGRNGDDANFEIRVNEVIECLDSYRLRSYKECLVAIAFALESEGPHSPVMGCAFTEYSPGFSPDDIPDEMKEVSSLDDVSAERVIEALIKSPTPPLGLNPASLGKLLNVLGPSLCALGTDWACDDSGSTTGSATGGDAP